MPLRLEAVLSGEVEDNMWAYHDAGSSFELCFSKCRSQNKDFNIVRKLIRNVEYSI